MSVVLNILNTIDDYIFVVNISGEILYCNSSIKRLAFDSEHLADMTIRDFYPQEYRNALKKLLDSVFEDEKPRYSYQFPILNRSGQYIPTEMKITKGAWKDLPVLYIIIHDISHWKRVEIENKMLSEALKNIDECLVVFDLNGKIMFVNEKFVNTYQYPKNEIVGRPFSDFHSSVNEEQITREIIKKSIKGGWHGELSGLKKNGDKLHLSFTTSVMNDENENPIVIIGIAVDLTEKKQLEKQLYQAQKMEAIGQLAGGIAHDFNNLLTVIDGYSEHLLVRCNEKKIEHAYVRQIRKASERAGSLTQQLLAFSRRQLMQPKLIHLNDLVREMVTLLKRLIGEDVELSTLLNPDIGYVRADKNQLEQVVMNLALNARDAMTEGGQLSIETKRVMLDQHYKNSHAGVNEGPYVMLAVSDTGVGMDKETQSRIFEPFFTTKEKGKGTGLGLATVYGIIKQSKGHIWVYSEPGRGTSFKIYLPAAKGNLKASNDGKKEQVLLKGDETVLVVEDEFMVRELVVNSLKQYGYSVLEASNGRQALELIKSNENAIQLVITDVVMPEVSGQKLVKALSEQYPDIKAIFMSGYSDHAVTNHGLIEERAFFIQKPFSPATLAQKVRDILDDTEKN